MHIFLRLSTLLLLGLLTGAPSLAAATGDAGAALAEARQHADDGRLREALAIYESLAETHPDNAVYLTGLGRTQLQLKRALAATWSLQDAIAADPEKEEAYQLLLQAYLESGQSERAYEILQEARKQFGDQPWMEDL